MAAKKKQVWITTAKAGSQIGRCARTIQGYCQEGHPKFLESERFGRYYMIDENVWEEWKARWINKKTSAA